MNNYSNKYALSYVTKNVGSEDIKYIFVEKFDDESLRKFYEKFIELENDANIKVIPVVIASYGGQVYSLLGMLDILKASTKPIATATLGKAMSCGAILLSAGTKGYRYAGENSTILIHEISTVEFGKNTEIQNGAKETRKLNNRIMNILAVNCGQKKNYFLDLLSKKKNIDLHLSANEAKIIGMVDFISIPKLLKMSDDR